MGYQKGKPKRIDLYLSETNKKRSLQINVNSLFSAVGMTRFELATTRPPDEYSKPG